MTIKLTKRPTDRKGRELWKKQKAEERAARKAAKASTKKARKAKPAKKAGPKTKAAKRPAKRERASDEHPKAFRLTGGIPDLPREGTSGRAILVAIKDRGLATAAEIAKDLPSGVSPLTLQKYLRMLEAGGTIAVATE